MTNPDKGLGFWRWVLLAAVALAGLLLRAHELGSIPL